MGQFGKIGFTCSCFDLLHAGHILMLKDAKEQCDFLVVGLQTDPTLDRPEKNKPIQSYEVKGKVSIESSYPISFKKYSVIDAFRDNIRLLDNSSIEGIYVERDSIKIPISGFRVSTEILKTEETMNIIYHLTKDSIVIRVGYLPDMDKPAWINYREEN